MLLSDEEEQEALKTTVTGSPANGNEQSQSPSVVGDATRKTKTSFSISELALLQEQATSSTGSRILQFLRLQLLGRPNDLEQYVMDSESNDCALVSKYKKIVTVDLSHDSTLTVDKVVLSGLHIPHPLVSFMSNENNQNTPTSIDLPKELHESPIIVFIHGLGGQMSQFEPLMGLLSQALEIMAIDLPGFGNSRLSFDHRGKLITEFTKEEEDRISLSIKAMSWKDFETDNIVTIVVEYLRQHIADNKTIILVGHSMGTHISTKVAARLPQSKVEGLVLLSPPQFFDDVSSIEPDQIQSPRQLTAAHRFAFFTYFPWLFDSFRTWDRLPGLSSASVQRQLTKDPNTNIYTKLRQFRWNMDVNSEIVLKYIYGFSKARCSELITAISKFNDRSQDKRVYEKTLFVGGEEDTMTPAKHIDEVVAIVEGKFGRKITNSIKIPNVGHSLLLSKPEFISGVILNHIESKFPERLHLSPAWVLKVKAEISGDKWGLKNEQKWSKIKLLSDNITRKNGSERAPLLGMKTLREGDANHSPTALEAKFYGEHTSDADKPEGTLIAVVDISADIPPYSPKSFKHIKYYKCATVSKVVPDAQAARRFIQLIDDIFTSTTESDPLIVVHCHYGFNRTGFLICCYLIEKLGWSVQEAINGFKEAKPPGIKHQHFIDELYVRYEHN